MAKIDISKYTNDPETTMTQLGGKTLIVELSESDENNTKLIQYLKKNGFTQKSSFRFTKDSRTSRLLDKAITTCDAVYSVSYERPDGPFQAIGVFANSESEAIKKAKLHLEKRGPVKIHGVSTSESLETMKRKGKPVIK